MIRKNAHNYPLQEEAMNPKPNTARSQADPPYITNDRPAVLGRRRMEKVELPPGFDLSYHKKILASGSVRPTTSAEFAEMIATLRKNLTK